jgi:hypothetical protein
MNPGQRNIEQRIVLSSSEICVYYSIQLDWLPSSVQAGSLIVGLNQLAEGCENLHIISLGCTATLAASGTATNNPSEIAQGWLSIDECAVGWIEALP